MFQNAIFSGALPRTSLRELTALPPDALADGEGARCSPPKYPTPALGPSGFVSTGLRG